MDYDPTEDVLRATPIPLPPISDEAWMIIAYVFIAVFLISILRALIFLVQEWWKEGRPSFRNFWKIWK